MKKRIALFLVMGIIICNMSGCGGSDDYKNTLYSGYNKYQSGQPMTQKEYNAVKSYNNWKSKQSSKTYSDWSK